MFGVSPPSLPLFIPPAVSSFPSVIRVCDRRVSVDSGGGGSGGVGAATCAGDKHTVKNKEET